MALQGGFQALIYLLFPLHHMLAEWVVKAFLSQKNNRFITFTSNGKIYFPKFFAQKKKKKGKKLQYYEIFTVVRPPKKGEGNRNMRDTLI